VRRIANARAELQKLALGMRDAAHGTRRLVTVKQVTANVISQKPSAQQWHNPTFPGADGCVLPSATLIVRSKCALLLKTV